MKLRKGGHADVKKCSTLAEVDYDSRELIPRLMLHKIISTGEAELVIASDDASGLDVAYALCVTKGMYNYVLLKYMAVYPWYRGKGIGKEFVRELAARYQGKQGLILEISGHNTNDKNDRLKKFASETGFENVECSYKLAGAPAQIVVKPLAGSADITGIADRVMKDFYSMCLTENSAEKMIRFE